MQYYMTYTYILLIHHNTNLQCLTGMPPVVDTRPFQAVQVTYAVRVPLLITCPVMLTARAWTARLRVLGSPEHVGVIHGHTDFF